MSPLTNLPQTTPSRVTLSDLDLKKKETRNVQGCHALLLTESGFGLTTGGTVQKTMENMRREGKMLPLKSDQRFYE